MKCLCSGFSPDRNQSGRRLAGSVFR